MSALAPDVVATIVDTARALEPSTRAVFLFGSRARGDEGPYSDVDVRVVTDGAPRVGARMTVLAIDGVLRHVSIGARSLDGMLASARTPSGWPWVAGFVDVAVTLDDPPDARGVDVRAQLRAAVNAWVPKRLESESGLHSDLEDMLEHLAKTRNARARRDVARVMRHAWHTAQNARRCLVPFGPVLPAAGGGVTEERALATMSDAFRDDVALIAGETERARSIDDVTDACVRTARAVVEKLEELGDDAPLIEPLKRDLIEGRVRALVEAPSPRP